MKLPIILAVTTLFLCGGVLRAEPMSGHGIPNLSEVEPGVWRGGQPTAAGWAWLKSQGVVFDLKLDTAAESSDDLARSNGLDVVSMPISLEQQTIGKPSATIIRSDANMIKVEKEKIPKGGIFVHCEHGQDRTGLIIGAYRVECEGWSKSLAYSEMLKHGFHPELLGLKRAWDEVHLAP